MVQFRNKIGWITLILLFLPFSGISAAKDIQLGVIRGRVLNKTLEENGIQGLEVILHQYTGDKASEVARTTIDETGAFLFKGINIDQRFTYYATTRYQAIPYFSLMLPFEEKKELTFDLPVYETTDQSHDLSVKMHHIFLEIDDGAFLVREAMIVENRGNRTYVGSREIQPGKKETLLISLPKEAVDVHSPNSHALESEGGLSDTSEIKPGTKKILFSYRINPQNSDYQFTKRINLKTDSLNFIFPDEGVIATSEHLKLKGSTQNAEQQFSYLSGENLQKGAQIVVNLSRSSTIDPFKWLILGLVTLLVTTAFILPLIKERVIPKSKRMPWMAQRTQVLQAIAELDSLQAADQISSETYIQKRRYLMQKAVEATKQGRNNTEASLKEA